MNVMEAADEHATMASVLSRQAGQYLGLKCETAEFGRNAFAVEKINRRLK